MYQLDVILQSRFSTLNEQHSLLMSMSFSRNRFETFRAGREPNVFILLPNK